MKLTTKEYTAMADGIVKSGQIPEFMKKHVELKPVLKPLLDRLMIYEVAYNVCTTDDAIEKRKIRQVQRAACDTFISKYYKRKYYLDFKMDGYEYFKAVCNCNPEYRLPPIVFSYVQDASDKLDARYTKKGKAN